MRVLLSVRGKRDNWSFCMDVPRAHFDAWKADGLDVVEIENTVPEIVAAIGLTRPWCWLQDLLKI